jgi:transposase
MAMERRSFDREFREGAVRIVRETGRPIAQVARELGLHEGTLGRWVKLDRQAREGEGPLSESERDELNRLRKENAELAMERDVLKRSAALWVLSRTLIWGYLTTVRDEWRGLFATVGVSVADAQSGVVTLRL